MCSNSSWFLIPGVAVGVLSLILNSFEVLIVRVCLIDVRLHHLVLLIDNGAGWNNYTLVAFLAGFTDSLECWVLVGCNSSQVILHCIHRLRSCNRSILSVSHLVLRSSELRTLAQISLLLSLNREAIRCLEGLCLTLRSVGHRRTCSVSRNLSLSLVAKD